MKKVLMAICMFLATTSIVAAQAPAKKTETATSKMKPATEAKVVKMKPAAAASNATPLKKDGTPDKRYKATAATEGPKKKDGTLDKRYKQNKKG